MGVCDVPMVVRVGMDGSATRVPFVTDEQGGSGALLREQIGCDLFDVIPLGEGLDMWVDEEAVAFVDRTDRVALAELLNPVASMIANHFGCLRPVFGAVVVTGLAGEATAALDDEQVAAVEELAAMSAGVFSDVLAARAGGN